MARFLRLLQSWAHPHTRVCLCVCVSHLHPREERAVPYCIGQEYRRLLGEIQRTKPAGRKNKMREGKGGAPDEARSPCTDAYSTARNEGGLRKAEETCARICVRRVVVCNDIHDAKRNFSVPSLAQENIYAHTRNVSFHIRYTEGRQLTEGGSRSGASPRQPCHSLTLSTLCKHFSGAANLP